MYLIGVTRLTWGERTPLDLGSEQSEHFRQCWSGTTEWSLRWNFGQNRALPALTISSPTWSLSLLL
jgi:hypothetical protein